jgi:hypothetical protein
VICRLASGETAPSRRHSYSKLGIKTFLNGTLTSNIMIDASTVTTDTIDSVLADQNGLTATSTRTIIIEVATSSQRSRPRKHAISDAFSSCYTALHISVRGAHSRVRYEHGESKSIRTH